MPIIYLDILIAVNLVIDYLLLSATSHILRLTPKRWRVLLGALFGALSSCLIFLTTVPTFLILVFHFMSACILVKITFPFSKISVFSKQVFVFYVMSALFSGVVSVLWALTKSESFYAYNGVVYFDISPLTLTAFAVVSYAVICLYEYVTRKRVPYGYTFSLCIDDGNGICKCRALYDTGMHLTEPFSGKPVVIVEQTVLEPYLSDEHKNVLCYANMPSGGKGAHIRFIPYRSLGTDGLLAAFVPRCLKIEASSHRQWDVSGAYVALSNSLGRGEYQALIGSDVMKGGL